MNTLESFVTSMPASMKTSTVIEQVETSSALYVDVIQDNLKYASELYKSNQAFKSKEAKELVEQFYRLTKIQNKNFFTDLMQALDLAVERAREVKSVMTKTMPKLITRDTLTYRQLGYMQFCAGVDFVINFAPKVLTYLMRAETCVLSGEKVESHYSKAALSDITENYLQFIQVIRVVGLKTSTVLTDLEQALDIVVEDDKVDVMASTHGSDKINPVRQGFLPPAINPFRIIGMAMAEYQAKRYHQLQEQLSLFQVLLAYQKQLLEKEVDPAVERRVEELSSIIEELQLRIKKMEQRYG